MSFHYQPLRRTLAAAFLAASPSLLAAGPIHETAFTYQGELAVNGAPAHGDFDFVFRLYDDEFAGVEVVSPLTLEDVPVSNGVFSATLDYGTNDFLLGFWLEIEVRPGDSTDPHTPLTGRVYIQQVPAAGQAQVALEAFDSSTLGGQPPSDFASADHFHSALVSPDGSIEVVTVDDSGDILLPGGAQLSTLPGGGSTSLEVDGTGVRFDKLLGFEAFSIQGAPGTETLYVQGADNIGAGTPAGDLYLVAGSNLSGQPETAGDARVRGGDNLFGAGGNASLEAGQAFSSGSLGGSISIFGGNSVDEGSGSVTINAGDTAAGTGGGGDMTLTAGQSSGGAGGDVEILAGDSVFGFAGNVTIAPGDSGGTNPGGFLSFVAGDGGGGALTGPGGEVLLAAGAGSQGGALAIAGGLGATVSGGAVEVRAGSGAVSSEAPGGELTLLGGNGGGLLSGNGASGGAVFIRGGDAEGDQVNPGGDVILSGGESSGGSNDLASVIVESPAVFNSTVGLFGGGLVLSGMADSFQIQPEGLNPIEFDFAAGVVGTETHIAGGGGGASRFVLKGRDVVTPFLFGTDVLLAGGSVETGGAAGGGSITVAGGDGATDGEGGNQGGVGGDVWIEGGDGRGEGQNSGGDVIVRGGSGSDSQPVRRGIIDIRSLVSIFRNGNRPDGGAILQVGSSGLDNGNGAFLSNDGVWTNASDANSKTVVGDVDAREVLARVLALPLKNWRHKSSDDGPIHMGPMAQDFFAAFGLGASDRHIGSVDADGVALAAIQGLHAEIQDRDARIADLEARLARLEALLPDPSQKSPN